MPHGFGLFRVAEIQAVCCRNWTRARARHVSRGFRDGVHRANFGVEPAPPAVSIGGEREAAPRILEPEHGGITSARHDARVCSHHVIVLSDDPLLRGDRRRGEQASKVFGEVCSGRSEINQACAAGRMCWRRDGAFVDWPFFRYSVSRNFSGNIATLQNSQTAIVGHAANFDGIEPPLLEDAKNFILAAALGDKQHAFLRFAQHDFVRRHVRLALRHAR